MLRLLITIVFVLFLSSCQRDDEKTSATGSLVVSVTEMDAIPDILYIYVYSEAQESPVILEMGTSLTVEQELRAGSWQVVLVGYNRKEVALQGEERFESLLFSMLPSGEENIYPALTDKVYSAVASSVIVEGGKSTSLSLSPSGCSTVVHLRVESGNGFDGMEVEGTLSGMLAAKTVSAESDVKSVSGLLSFALSSADTPGGYMVNAGVLGVASGEKQLLELLFREKNGRTYTCSADLTPAFSNIQAGGRDTLDISVTVSPAVPIRLTTGIRTRAAVDAFDNTPVCVASGSQTGQYAGCWEGVASGGEIRLIPERYYPSDGSMLYLRGFYPPAPLENGEVHYTLTGKEDLMLTDEISGNLANSFDGSEGKKELTYNHLLSLLGFTLEMKNVPSGYRVSGLDMNGFLSTVTVSLAEGGISHVAEKGKVIVYAAPDGEGIPVVNGRVSLPGYVLIVPNSELTVDLTLSHDSNPANDRVIVDLPVVLKETEGGTAFEIVVSLDFPDPEPPVDPNPPVDPDPPVNPDIPVDPDPPIKDRITVSISARVCGWNEIAGGNIDFTPVSKMIKH